MNNVPDFPTLVYTHLRWGADGAKTIGQIQADMNVSRRVIEKAVEELRAGGAPICSGSAGVWLTTSESELIEQYRALRRRYIRQAVNARHLLRTAKAYGKYRQTTLFGDAA